LGVWLQDWKCENAEKRAVIVEEVGLPIPVVHTKAAGSPDIDWTAEIAEVANSSLSDDVEQCSNAVETEAVSSPDVDWTVEIAEVSNSGWSDVEQCSNTAETDTVAMSIPVLLSHQVSSPIDTVRNTSL